MTGLQMESPTHGGAESGLAKAQTQYTANPPTHSIELVIPQKMLDASRWLLWKLQHSGTPGVKPRKVPYYINNRNRSGKLDSDEDLAQLATFKGCWKAYNLNASKLAGIGFAVTGDGVAAFDLDNVLDESGKHDSTTEAGRIVDEAIAAGCYVEVSPSGRGLRIFGASSTLDSYTNHAQGIEYYAAGRFLTVTGDVYENSQGWGSLDSICASLPVRKKTQATHGALGQAPDMGTGNLGEPETPSGLARLQSALAALDPSMSYPQWRDLVWSCTATGWDSAIEAARDWSRGSLKYDDAGFDTVVADYRHKPGGIGVGSLFCAAAAAGWQDPRHIATGIVTPDNSGDVFEEAQGRDSQASQLVKFVTERCELFHDQNRESFAHVRENGRNFRIDGRGFKDWLSADFFEVNEKTPRTQALAEAIGTLSGLARHRGEQHEVFLRVGLAGGAYYLDMCEPDTSRAIELKPGHWCIVDKPPVRFTRTEAMQPLPMPAAKGDIGSLWEVANIPDDKRVLIVTWLIDALRPDTPFCVLELVGEPGSAKSTTHTALKRVVDPNVCDLRAPPKVTEDCFISAGVNWVVSYENVSHLPAPMQDALCVLATGGGFAKRKLYSDGEESVINVKRPIILNGISANVTAHDLADRAVSIELPVIKSREEIAGVLEAFEGGRPAILAGLLDIASRALAILPSIQVPAEERPRMLEFYKLGLSVGEVIGSDFKAQFNATRTDAVSRTIEGSPVAAALVDWFDGSQRRTAEMGAKALMQAVERYRPEHAEAWPKSPKGFADALRRAAPSLRHMGIECRPTGKKVHGGVIEWRVSQR